MQTSAGAVQPASVVTVRQGVLAVVSKKPSSWAGSQGSAVTVSGTVTFGGQAVGGSYSLTLGDHSQIEMPGT